MRRSATSTNTLARNATFAAALALTAASGALAQSSVTIFGTVRDFRTMHPDFGLSLGAVGSHAAGNVELLPDANSKPVFAGSGALVNTQYYEKNANEIAPHMYAAPGGGTGSITLVKPIGINNSPTIDTYDPSLGPYDPVTNSGPMPDIVSGATMPTVPAWPGGLPNLGDVEVKGNGTTILSSSFRCTKFVLQDGRDLIIQGDVTIVANDLFNIENNTEILLDPGATLTVYVRKDGIIKNNVSINTNTADHTRVVIYNVSNDKEFVIENDTFTYATLISPDAPIMIKNNAEFFGSITADSLAVENIAGVHIAGAGGAGATCANLADLAGGMGSASSGNITDSFTFSQWFRTNPLVNAATTIPMTFFAAGGGVLEFDEADFAPIDNELYGNEGEPANRNFTLEFTARFNNTACAGHFFEFYGDGDIWLYIDDKLVIDLAGPVEGAHQYIDVDRLGLVDGKSYYLRFFYAQRVADGTPFRIRTNLPLESTLSSGAPTMAYHD